MIIDTHENVVELKLTLIRKINDRTVHLDTESAANYLGCTKREVENLRAFKTENIHFEKIFFTMMSLDIFFKFEIEEE